PPDRPVARPRRGPERRSFPRRRPSASRSSTGRRLCTLRPPRGASAALRGRAGSPLSLVRPDHLDPVAVRILDEAKPRSGGAHLIRRPLGFDPPRGEFVERLVEVVHADGDVAVGGAELIRAPVVVVGELELLLLPGEAEEVVRRLGLAVADDVHVAAKL